MVNLRLLPDLPGAGAVAALVEAVEAVRQVGSKLQLHFVPPSFSQHGVRQQGELMEMWILQHPERPHAFRLQEHHVRDLHLLGVEHDHAGVLQHVQLDAHQASEVEGGQVGVDAEVVVERVDGFGKSHAVPWERLAVGGDGGVFGLALIGQLCSG